MLFGAETTRAASRYRSILSGNLYWDWLTHKLFGSTSVFSAFKNSVTVFEARKKSRASSWLSEWNREPMTSNGLAIDIVPCLWPYTNLDVTEADRQIARKISLFLSWIVRSTLRLFNELPRAANALLVFLASRTVKDFGSSFYPPPRQSFFHGNPSPRGLPHRSRGWFSAKWNTRAGSFHFSGRRIDIGDFLNDDFPLFPREHRKYSGFRRIERWAATLGCRSTKWVNHWVRDVNLRQSTFIVNIRRRFPVTWMSKRLPIIVQSLPAGRDGLTSTRYYAK